MIHPVGTENSEEKKKKTKIIFLDHKRILKKKQRNQI